MNLSGVTDARIHEEYVRRFTIAAGEHIRSSAQAAKHFRAFFHEADRREQFVVLFVNGQKQVLATEVLFTGSITSSAIYPREVVQRVLDVGAAAVAFAHNHPSGATEPSASDRQVTRKLQTALDAIDVQVLDHIILGGEDYLSFADAGLI